MKSVGQFGFGSKSKGWLIVFFGIRFEDLGFPLVPGFG